MLDAAGCRVQRGLQPIEREHVADGQYKFAIKRELLAIDLLYNVRHIQKVSAQRLPGLGYDLDVIACLEDEGTKAIPCGSGCQALSSGISETSLASIDRRSVVPMMVPLGCNYRPFVRTRDDRARSKFGLGCQPIMKPTALYRTDVKVAARRQEPPKTRCCRTCTTSAAPQRGLRRSRWRRNAGAPYRTPIGT